MWGLQTHCKTKFKNQNQKKKHKTNKKNMMNLKLEWKLGEKIKHLREFIDIQPNSTLWVVGRRKTQVLRERIHHWETMDMRWWSWIGDEIALRRSRERERGVDCAMNEMQFVISYNENPTKQPKLSSVSLFHIIIYAEVRLQIAKLLTWKHDQKSMYFFDTSLFFFFFEAHMGFPVSDSLVGCCSASHIYMRDGALVSHKIIKLLISFPTCSRSLAIVSHGLSFHS